MSNEHKGFGGKLKSLFVEDGEGAPEQAEEQAKLAADEVARIAAKAALPATTAFAPSFASSITSGPPVEAAKLDFASIFRTAGLADDEQDQVAKAQQLLSSLPQNLPRETQRSIVEGTLKTFGVDPSRIRAACQREQKALDTYALVTRQDLDKRSAEGQKRLVELQAEMAKVQHTQEERTRAQAAVETACRTQKETIGRVVEFFSAPASAGDKP